MTDRIDTPAPIVVGLDDTAASRAALAFALEEADRRGSAVDVVTAWSWRVTPDGAIIDTSREDARAAAQLVQDEGVAAVLGEVTGQPTMTRHLIEGDAAEVLVRVARAAAYLLLGTSRKGRLRRVLLGSVSEECVRRAGCPVMVVPPPTELAEADTSDLAEKVLSAPGLSTVQG